jgi:hypothetical protein
MPGDPDNDFYAEMGVAVYEVEEFRLEKPKHSTIRKSDGGGRARSFIKERDFAEEITIPHLAELLIFRLGQDSDLPLLHHVHPQARFTLAEDDFILPIFALVENPVNRHKLALVEVIENRNAG